MHSDVFLPTFKERPKETFHHELRTEKFLSISRKRFCVRYQNLYASFAAFRLIIIIVALFTISVTRLGHFRIVLATKFLRKVAQIFGDFLGYFETTLLLNLNISVNTFPSTM